LLFAAAAAAAAAATAAAAAAAATDNQGNPIQITNGFYEGDKFRPYLPTINPNVDDTK
jgi:opacity protein-like surface antigen